MIRRIAAVLLTCTTFGSACATATQKTLAPPKYAVIGRTCGVVLV